jgi:ABC-2 type transport system permease protein
VDYGSEQEAMAALDEGEIVRVLTIPAGFSADVQTGRRTTLELVNSPDASAEQTAAVREVVAGVASTFSLETQLIEAFRQMDQMMAMASPEYRVFTETTIEQQARSQFERSREGALVSAVMRLPKSLVGEQEELGMQVTVAGFLVLFVFLTAQATAQSIYDEKKVGSFRRLLAAPMSKAELLAGKMLPNFIVTLAQIIVILAAGVYLFPLLGMEKLTLGKDPVALVVLSMMVALCSSSIGVLIAALARTESQVSSISSVGLWVMGALGGAFMPTFLLGGFIETISKVVPHSWAATAYYDLLLRGKGIADIMPELAVLAGFTLVFAVIGIWRFEFDS